MSTNLMLDKKNPETGKTFRQLIMAINPENAPDIPLFHTIDKQWRSDSGVTFAFRPEHETEARSIVAVLIPVLRDEGHEWFLRMFSADAQQHHVSSRWDAATTQVFSIEEVELAEFSATDDDLNLTNEPTQQKEECSTFAYKTSIDMDVLHLCPKTSRQLLTRTTQFLCFIQQRPQLRQVQKLPQLRSC
jgi:hypothetical protein